MESLSVTDGQISKGHFEIQHSLILPVGEGKKGLDAHPVNVTFSPPLYSNLSCSLKVVLSKQGLVKRQRRQRNGHGGLRKPNLLQNYAGEGGLESTAEAAKVQVTQMKPFQNHPLCIDLSSFLLFLRLSVASPL